MVIKLRESETLLKESAANLQRGKETVGGRLFLTSERLVFMAHKFNIQRGTTEIAIGEIIDTEPRWTKFLGLVPLFPNSLAIRTRDGTEFSFVLAGRSVWADVIKDACDH